MPAMDADLCWRCGYWSKDRLRLRMSINIFVEAKPETSQVRCKHGRIGHKCLR